LQILSEEILNGARSDYGQLIAEASKAAAFGMG